MIQRQHLRAAFLDWGMDFNPNVILTLTTSQPWKAEKMRSLVGRFFGRLDRKLLGNAWLKRPVEERLDGIAFVEKPNINLHAHCCVRVDIDRWYQTLRASTDIWKKLCPSGRVHFEPVGHAFSAIDYCLKETEGQHYKFDDQIILLKEFHPQR